MAGELCHRLSPTSDRLFLPPLPFPSIAACRADAFAIWVKMTFWTFDFSVILRGPSHTSQNVLSHRHRFQMIRIHAGGSSTQMVDGQTFGDWSLEKFIGEAMGEDIAVNRASARESPVSTSFFRSDPQPAGRRLEHFGPETLNRRFNSRRHSYRLCWRPLRRLPSLRSVIASRARCPVLPGAWAFSR